MIIAVGVKAIFFDFGGTLYDLSDSVVGLWKSVCEEENIEFSEELFFAALHTQRIKLDLYTAKKVAESSDPSVGTSYWRDFNREILWEFGIRKESLLKDISVHIVERTKKVRRLYQIKRDALATIQILKEKYAIGLISNTTSDLREYLREDHLLSLFDFVGLSNELGLWKPDKKIFLESCSRLNIAPSEGVHVGDSHVCDLLGAKGSGMQSVYVRSYKALIHSKTDEPFISTLSELIDLLMPQERGD